MSLFVKNWAPAAVIQIAVFVGLHGVGGTAGGVAAVVTALPVLVWWARASKRRLVKVLRVENGVLTVTPRDGLSEATHFYLRELDVVLDTKTVRKVVDGNSMLAAVRFTDSKIAPEIDMSRIVLTSGDERYLLSDHFLSHTEAVDSFGKIRVFLRKNGWLPADERDLL
jgi:hypothetical protein